MREWKVTAADLHLGFLYLYLFFSSFVKVTVGENFQRRALISLTKLAENERWINKSETLLNRWQSTAEVRGVVTTTYPLTLINFPSRQSISCFSCFGSLRGLIDKFGLFVVFVKPNENFFAGSAITSTQTIFLQRDRKARVDNSRQTHPLSPDWILRDTTTIITNQPCYTQFETCLYLVLVLKNV